MVDRAARVMTHLAAATLTVVRARAASLRIADHRDAEEALLVLTV